MDDGQSTVHYQISVTEGDLYRMGELQVDGLDPELTNKVIAQWQLKKGDPYDNEYLIPFFKVMFPVLGQRVRYSVVPKQAINQQDKTVTVSLHFVPK
jgi:outer membrane protein assembly factor BamA